MANGTEPEVLRMPHARVKRTMKEDPEVMAVSNAAVHTMSAAAQLFIGHFAEQALLNARASGRNRLTYQDFANSVVNQEELVFLSEIVPRTITHAEAKARREAVGTEEVPGIPFARKAEQMESEAESASD